MGRQRMIEWEMEMQREDEGAEDIQRVVRGFLVRRNRNINYWDYWNYDSKGRGSWIHPLPKEIRDSAATELQRLSRGFIARKFWPGVRLFTVL